jgi:hypothetical protein
MVLAKAANKSTLCFRTGTWCPVPAEDVCPIGVLGQGKWLSAGSGYNCRVTNTETLVPTWAA